MGHFSTFSFTFFSPPVSSYSLLSLLEEPEAIRSIYREPSQRMATVWRDLLRQVKVYRGPWSCCSSHMRRNRQV
jgi:hypothetical protein